MTHRQIEAFRAVMITGSVTEAAKMLSVTQPAVSKILRQLEAEIGFCLFHREGSLRPSEEAEILFHEIKRSYVGLDQIAWTAAQIRNRASGTLRVATLPAFSGGILQRVVRNLLAQDETIRLSLQSYNSEEVVDLVASGLCDIGYAMTPVLPARVRVGEVMSVPSFAVLRRDHPLAGRPRISIRDLAGEKFISMSEGTSSRLRIDSLFTSYNVPRTQIVEARWSLTVVGLVAQGLGCAIIDGFSAQAADAAGCVALPLAEPVDFTFVCVRRRQGREATLVGRFAAAFEAELARLNAECGQ